MTFFDAILSNYRWWRRWRGGLWIRVSPRMLPQIVIWIRERAPTDYELILDMENHG